jgi:hypothetical protein
MLTSQDVINELNNYAASLLLITAYNVNGIDNGGNIQYKNITDPKIIAVFNTIGTNMQNIFNNISKGMNISSNLDILSFDLNNPFINSLISEGILPQSATSPNVNDLVKAYYKDKDFSKPERTDIVKNLINALKAPSTTSPASTTDSAVSSALASMSKKEGSTGSASAKFFLPQTDEEVHDELIRLQKAGKFTKKPSSTITSSNIVCPPPGSIYDVPTSCIKNINMYNNFLQNKTQLQQNETQQLFNNLNDQPASDIENTIRQAGILTLNSDSKNKVQISTTNFSFVGKQLDDKQNDFKRQNFQLRARSLVLLTN